MSVIRKWCDIFLMFMGFCRYHHLKKAAQNKNQLKPVITTLDIKPVMTQSVWDRWSNQCYPLLITFYHNFNGLENKLAKLHVTPLSYVDSITLVSALIFSNSVYELWHVNHFTPLTISLLVDFRKVMVRCFFQSIL